MLTTVVSLDKVHVHFDADERSFLRYARMEREGERPSERDGQVPVQVALADEDGFPHAGVVDFLDNQVDRSTGTIRARAVLDNAGRVFTPGLYARVRLLGSGEFKAALVDDKAVLTDQDRNYVYIVDKDGLAQRRDVQLGGSSHGLRIVREGLAAGDRVIVNGTQKVFFPGMPVQARPVAEGERELGLIVETRAAAEEDAVLLASVLMLGLAAALGKMLQLAWRSPAMPELMGSLPSIGVDGTLKRRQLRGGGSAHLKTGTLRDMAALTGGMHVDRDAAPVIAHADAAVGMDLDLHEVGMAGQDLVDAVVHDLIDHVVQAGPVVGVADIHARPLADGFQTLQNLDGIRAIFIGVGQLLGALAGGVGASVVHGPSYRHLRPN